METQKLPEEVVLSKEKANQAASELIEEFKKVLNGTKEFTDALSNEFFKDGINEHMDFRIGVHMYRTEIKFTKGNSVYAINYEPYDRVRPDKQMYEDSNLNYLGMHSLRLWRGNNYRHREEGETVCLSSVTSLDVWKGKPKSMPFYEKYGFIRYWGKDQREVTNSPLAVQKAKGMLEELTSQSPQK